MDKQKKQMLSCLWHSNFFSWFFWSSVLACITGAIIISSFFPGMASSSGSPLVMIGFLLFLLTGFCLATLSLYRNCASRMSCGKLGEWGKKYGYALLEDGVPASKPSAFFGEDGKSDDVLRGSVSGFPVEMFAYTCLQPEGKEKRMQVFTVFCLNTKQQMPKFAFFRKLGDDLQEDVDIADAEFLRHLDVRVENASSLSFNTKSAGDFTLNVEKGYEVEALQILAPETMQFIGERWPHYFFQGEGTFVYAVKFERFSSEEEFSDMHELAAFLISKLQPSVKDIGSSVEAVRETRTKDQFMEVYGSEGIKS